MVGERLLMKPQDRDEMADATPLAYQVWQGVVVVGSRGSCMTLRSVRCWMIRAVTRSRSSGNSTLFPLIRTAYCSRQINTEHRGLFTTEQTANLKDHLPVLVLPMDALVENR